MPDEPYRTAVNGDSTEDAKLRHLFAYQDAGVEANAVAMRVRRAHRPEAATAGQESVPCQSCGAPWPCDPARLAASVVPLWNAAWLGHAAPPDDLSWKGRARDLLAGATAVLRGWSTPLPAYRHGPDSPPGILRGDLLVCVGGPCDGQMLPYDGALTYRQYHEVREPAPTLRALVANPPPPDTMVTYVRKTAAYQIYGSGGQYWYQHEEGR